MSWISVYTLVHYSNPHFYLIWAHSVLIFCIAQPATEIIHEFLFPLRYANPQRIRLSKLGYILALSNAGELPKVENAQGQQQHTGRCEACLTSKFMLIDPALGNINMARIPRGSTLKQGIMDLESYYPGVDFREEPLPASIDKEVIIGRKSGNARPLVDSWSRTAAIALRDTTGADRAQPLPGDWWAPCRLDCTRRYVDRPALTHKDETWPPIPSPGYTLTKKPEMTVQNKRLRYQLHKEWRWEEQLPGFCDAVAADRLQSVNGAVFTRMKSPGCEQSDSLFSTAAARRNEPKGGYTQIYESSLQRAPCDMNEDGALLGRFCETPTTYTDFSDELAESIWEKLNINENNYRSPSNEKTSLSENLIEEVSLSKFRGWTSSTCADEPIGLSPKILQMSHLNGHGESFIHDNLTPRIVVTGVQASEAIHPGQPLLYTEGDDKNINEAKVPGGEVAINKPYLHNPVVSHYGEGGDR
uniref:Uncharacterized protein n=1 Tax=Talaromyces marneffei PM1 TaxID=1077442 RepID=A0A093UNA6_TALMA